MMPGLEYCAMNLIKGKLMKTTRFQMKLKSEL